MKYHKNEIEYFFFPSARKSLFTNRVGLLERLGLALEELQTGSPHPVVLIGRRRIGKSELLRYWISSLRPGRVFPVWIDLQEAGTAPIALSRYWFCCTAYWFLEKDHGSAARFLMYQDFDTALRLAVEAKNKVLSETGLAIQRELANEKPDERFLLATVFDLGEQLAQDSRGYCLLIIDEFQDLTFLSNFRQIREPLGLFRGRIDSHQRTLYVAAGSAVRMMEGIFTSGQSPLFGRFRTEYVGPLSAGDTFRLAAKLCPELSPKDLAEIYRLTGGHPYYVLQVARRCRELLAGQGIQEDLSTRAFVLETSFSGGAIYQYCQYIMDTSLRRARGYGMLKNILLTLAARGALTLADLSKGLKRKPGEVNVYLDNLISVYLIVKSEQNRYQIADPVLAYWLRTERLGLGETAGFSERVIRDLMRELQERFSQKATELGRAKEFELYYFVERHQGKKVRNCLIPHFRRMIKNYLLPNGQEIDLFAINQKTWVFELKWKGKRTGKKELESFLKKIQADQYVYISGAGFTPEAIGFARKQRIHLWTREELEE